MTYYKECNMLDVLDKTNLIDNIKSNNDMCPDVLIGNEFTTTEQIIYFSNFIEEIGFCNRNDYISVNFTDKENYSDLYNITNFFGDLLKLVDFNNVKLVSEIEKVKNLKYFENDEFIFIPDYGEFEFMDIFCEIPNFIHKKSGYVIRFKNGIGRSFFCNKKISDKEFQTILYNCKLSLVNYFFEK